MKISTKGQYGLMLMVDIALHAPAGPVPLKATAERCALSEHYLEQLIAPLRNAGFVRSVRGAYGGYQLARPKTDITAADIILTLEGPLTLVDAEVDDGFDMLWHRLRTSITAVLTAATLHDLVEMRLNQNGRFMFYI